MTKRTQQVAGEIQQIVGQLIQFQLQDPRIAFCTIVKVEMSPDLQMAHIFVSVMGDESARKDTMAALERAKGFVRRELARELRHLRTAPDIRFKLDETLDHSMRIGELIRDMNKPQ
ncbi:MAG: 30S ribosome-binding factor RbfA [Chloroflexi bacterium]|nr:30S ribosome-binding factor RbfA [Chloroflexota bacterium]